METPDSALKVRNFRLFFIGGTVSNTGRWMTALTIPYIMNELTGKGLWVGLGGLAHLLPAALLSPLAGSLADRYPRRSILLITQTLSALAILCFAFMWAGGVRSPYAYLAMSVISGVVSGLGISSWQAFVSELVPKELLLQAVSLNSAQFAGARALGPVIAGFVLQWAGPTWTFAIDAASFSAALLATYLIRVEAVQKADRGNQSTFAEFRETIGYVMASRGLSTCVVGGFVVGLFGMSILGLLVLFTDGVYEVDARWLGWMTGIVGLGAVLATPLVGRAKQGIARSKLLGLALTVYSFAIFCFAVVPSFWGALVALLVVGSGHIVCASVLNTTIQIQVEETKRGKTLSLYLMGILVGVPLGQFLMGSAADLVGARAAVASGACLLGLATLWLFRSGRLTSLDADVA